MKVKIKEEEEYPFYSLTTNKLAENVEITEEDYEFITKAMDNFWQAQEIMRKAYWGTYGK